MRKLSLTFFCMISALSAFAQRDVAQERMEQIFEEAKTPYKYGLVVASEDNHHKIDCPTVFRQGDKWLMTYVVDGDLLQVFNRLYLIDINVMFGKHLLIELGMCLQVG